MTHLLTRTLFTLAQEFSHLMSDEQTETLSYEEYASLAEYETKLMAFGNLLSAINLEDFLAAEISDAKDYLRCSRLRLGTAAGNKENVK